MPNFRRLAGLHVASCTSVASPPPPTKKRRALCPCAERDSFLWLALSVVNAPRAVVCMSVPRRKRARWNASNAPAPAVIRHSVLKATVVRLLLLMCACVCVCVCVSTCLYLYRCLCLLRAMLFYLCYICCISFVFRHSEGRMRRPGQRSRGHPRGIRMARRG